MTQELARIQDLLSALPTDNQGQIDGAFCYIGDTSDRALGAGPDDAFEMLQRGRMWLMDNVDVVRSAICPNKVVKAFIRQGDLLAAATALLGLLPSLSEQKIVGVIVLASRGALAEWCCDEG